MDCIDIYLQVKDLNAGEQKSTLFKLCKGDQKLIDEVNVVIDINQKNESEIITDKPILPENFDEFEVFEKVEHLTGSLLEQALISACAGNKEHIKEVKSLLNGKKLQDKGFDAIKLLSSSLAKIQEGVFDPQSLIGANADNYILIKHLKTGGNSFIYLAERLDEMHHQVVVKVIKPHLHNLYDYNVISREANILFKLSHKYIVPLNGAGILQHNGIKLPFYRMPFISDNDILSHAKKMGSSIEQRIRNIIKVCDGVEEAHSLDVPVIHADIKPPNTLMDIKGEPKIIDFGIAQHAYDSALNDIDRARIYAEKYSDAYSSPELLSGSTLSVQADVYSIGVMLYELLTELEPTQKERRGFFKFDIKNKLPSQNLAIAFSHKKRYSLCIKELDAIILRATHDDLEIRYKKVVELREELQRFLDFREVYAANRSYFYNLGKMLLSTPKFASFAVVSGCILAVSISLSVSLVSKQESNNADLALSSDINDHFYQLSNTPGYNTYSLLSDSKKTITDANNANNSTKLNIILNLAKTADLKMLWPFSEWYYSNAISYIESPQDEILLLPKLAKSLYKQNKLGEAENIINGIYSTLKHDGINSRNETIAYLDLLDFDTKYISASLDDTRQDLEILEDINKNKSISLPYYYKSKLNYLLANEYYYFYFGDTINPTIGLEDNEYNNAVKPMLKKALNHINRVQDEELKAQNYALMARIKHELKDYKEADQLADKSYLYATDKYGLYHEVTDKALVAKYSVNRFNNLQATIIAAERLIASIERKDGYKDDWFYGAYLLNNAYLSAGDYSKSQQVLSDMIYFYDKNKDNLVFKGLDGVRVAILNYLEFTHFNFNEEFYKKIIPLLLTVFDQTTSRFPDYISSYEPSLMKLINAANNNEQQQAYVLINDLLIKRKNGHKQTADDLGQLALNAAGIMFSFGNDEMSYLLAQVAEDNMVWSERERTHSTAKMMNYLQLSDIYLASKDFDKYDNAMAEASVVFNNHYRVLKDTSYAQAFKNIVITKN